MILNEDDDIQMGLWQKEEKHILCIIFDDE